MLEKYDMIIKEYPKLRMEECVVYYDQNNKCWVAHGIQTNQIGTGSSVYKSLVNFLDHISALVEVKKVVGDDLEFFSLAPQTIQNMLKKAIPIPEIIYTRARSEHPTNNDIREALSNMKFSHAQVIRTKLEELLRLINDTSEDSQNEILQEEEKESRDFQKRIDIPREEEIKQLPRWARVAFAARCARRVQPLFTAFWPVAPQKHIDMIKQAINAVEISADIAEPRVHMYTSSDLLEVGREAVSSFSENNRSYAYLVSAVAALAASAASATYYAEVPLGAKHAADVMSIIVRDIVIENKIRSRILYRIREDYDVLIQLVKEKKWDDDTPVSPEVFGPMWPEGEPDWKEIAAQAEKQDSKEQAERKKLEPVQQQMPQKSEEVSFCDLYDLLAPTPKEIFLEARGIAEKDGAGMPLTRTCLLLSMIELGDSNERRFNTAAFLRKNILDEVGKTNFDKYRQEYINDSKSNYYQWKTIATEILGPVTDYISSILALAAEYAERTTGEKTIHVRHLLAALLLYQPSIGELKDTILKHPLTRVGASVDGILKAFPEHLKQFPENKDGLSEGWREILAVQDVDEKEEKKKEPKGITSDVVHGNISDQPAKDEKDDKLDFKYYVNGMAEFLTSDRTEAPLSLSIEGPWGSGKSSFMMMLKEKLKKEGKPTIWFNAWRHDKAEAMCATFALVFLEQMNKNPVISFFKAIWFFITFQFAKSKQYWIDLWRSLRGRFKLFWYRFDWTDGWMDMLRCIGMWAVIVVSLIAGGVIGWNAGYGLFDKLVTEWQGTAGRILSTLATKEILQIVGGTGGLAGVVAVLITLTRKLKNWIGNPLEINLKKYVTCPDYEGHVQFVEKFHNDFKKVVKAFAGNQKVYVFIDDVDRCMVPKSADLMQALNMLICNSPNLIFIVGMDREKVAAGLAVKFEKLLPYLESIPDEMNEKDGKYIVPPDKAKKFGYEFIEKFIQLPFRLPKPHGGMIHDYIRQLCGNGKVDDEADHSVKIVPEKQTLATKPDFGQLNVLKDTGVIVEKNQDKENELPEIKDVDINKRPEDEKQAEKIREVVDDGELLCRVGEVAAIALENNPRRIKQFINLYRLRTYLASGQNIINMDGETVEQTDWTLERLAKFVAIELRWPMFLAEVLKNRNLLKLSQAHALGQIQPIGKWAEDELLLKFMKEGCEKDDMWNLADVNIESLMEVSGAVAEGTEGEASAL